MSKQETTVRAVLNDMEIDFKIIKYREDDGKLELEPITTRYVALGISHLIYPGNVTFLKRKPNYRRSTDIS